MDSNTRFVTLSDYVSPTVTENRKHDYVEYGDDNNFFQHLIDLFNSSPTNQACITGTTDHIYGGGLAVVQSDRRLEGYVNLKKTFRPKDVKAVCFDYKLYGMAAFELIKSKNRKKIVQALHLPMNYLRSGIANDKGQVEDWYYSPDWTETRKKGNKPQVIKAFGHEKNDERCVLVVKSYSAGQFYYCNPDYLSSTQWSDVEGELSNYHLNNLKNGMFAGMMLNFNNGVPAEDEQRRIEKTVMNKWGGTSNTNRIVLQFNRDKESAATIEPIQVSDAADQFQAVATEASEKILLSHRITSPRLLGINTSTSGLGNNAEELEVGHKLFVNTVVKPLQEPILEAVDSVLNYNGYALDIYFKPITPLEFKDYSINVSDDEKEKDTGLQMSEAVDLDGIADDLIRKGETEESLQGYELFDADWADDEASEDDIESRLNNLVTLSANEASYQDGKIFKVRYLYKDTAKDRPSDPRHRPLCSKLLSASLIYRKEDITSMSSKGGAEDKGQRYDVFLHKGGANCAHGWERRIYRKKLKKDGEAWGGGAMNGVSRSKIYDAIRGDATISQSADKKAMVAPRDTKTKGYK